MSDLVSGEAVLLELRVARLASRGLAMALDVVIQAATLLIVFLLLSTGGAFGFDDALAGAVTILTLVIVLIGYPATMETLTRGQTVGKIAAGLRVVRVDGGPIRFRHALVRALAGAFVDFWVLGVFGAVAVIVSMSSKNAQRVGDMLAGTLVIRERIPQQRQVYTYLPPQLAPWAAELPVGAIPNDLALAIRQYLGRIRELSPSAAGQLGWGLATEVSGHLGSPIPPGMPLETYLGTVLAERRRREEARLYQPQHPHPQPQPQPQPSPSPQQPPHDPLDDPLDDGPFAPPT
ncbi:RDD family protein [Actinocrispum sp. NPDC049592]|uniref:RDD family protein n=1 Tax=Actinocrispum sp. NPDC049592 TaxID=3154835 RepID=UPI00342D4358